jgi:hypothetical protein
LQHFKFSHVCPLDVAVDLIRLEGFLKVARNLITKLVLRGTSESLELHLSDKLEKALLSMCDLLTTFPFFPLSRKLSSFTNDTDNGVIGNNDGQGFLCNLPILPLH